MQANRIEDMDFKELRKEVQRLRDDLVRTKRSYEDLLYNLDDDNFSGVYRKKTKNMESSIEQTTEQIKMTVSKTLNYGDAVYGTLHPNSSSLADTERLYYWDAKNSNDKGYYYFDDIQEEWLKSSNKSIYSAFIQTANGFEFDANIVKINGDLITEGTITGTNFLREDVAMQTRTSINPMGIDVSSYNNVFQPRSTEIRTYGINIRDLGGELRASLQGSSLQFMGDDGSAEGWGILCPGNDGGELCYYLDGIKKFIIGEDDANNMSIKYANNDADGFLNALIIDMSESDKPEIIIKGLNTEGGNMSPKIEVNGFRLATQDWVTAQLAQGTTLV